MSKSTTKSNTPQQLIAGITKNDKAIEFFAIKETKEVMFLQNGKTHLFKDLPGFAVKALVNAYEQDREAKHILSNLKDENNQPVNLNYARQVELYTYFCYGSLDHQPDIIDGCLQEPENFRETKDCISLNFRRKQIKIGGQVLKPREVMMIDLFADSRNFTGAVIADKMGIAESTFNQHKRELFNRAGVMTTTALMIKAVREQVIV